MSKYICTHIFRSEIERQIKLASLNACRALLDRMGAFGRLGRLGHMYVLYVLYLGKHRHNTYWECLGTFWVPLGVFGNVLKTFWERLARLEASWNVSESFGAS